MLNKETLAITSPKQELFGVFKITLGEYISTSKRKAIGYERNSSAPDREDLNFGEIEPLYSTGIIQGTNGEYWQYNLNNFRVLHFIYADNNPTTYAVDISFTSKDSRYPCQQDSTVYFHCKHETGLIKSWQYTFDIKYHPYSVNLVNQTIASCVLLPEKEADITAGKTVLLYIGNSPTPPHGYNPLFFKQLFNLQEGCLDVQQQSFANFKWKTNGATKHLSLENIRGHEAQRFVAQWEKLGSYRTRNNAKGSDQYKDYDRNDFSRLLQSYVFKRIQQYRDFVSRSTALFVSTSHRHKSCEDHNLRQLSFCASHIMGGAYA